MNAGVVTFFHVSDYDQDWGQALACSWDSTIISMSIYSLLMYYQALYDTNLHSTSLP